MNCPPNKVIEQMKKGSNKVTYCGRKYSQNGNVIKREGERVCAEYHKKNITKKCFK